MKLFTSHQEDLFYKITSRYGGVSTSPYDSLNLALHVGDKPKNVLENRTKLAENNNYYLENLIYMNQTHRCNIEIIKDPAINLVEDCDAIITNLVNIPLMVMVADCIPILLYDPKQKVISVVHAGRNGTFKEIAKKTVLKMEHEYSSIASNILVYLGPSIRQCCYEIGEELINIVKKNFDEKYIEKGFLDLQQMNLDQLVTIGVKKENIETSPICTCCDSDYFSYRREGITGRFAGILKLK